MKELSNRSDAPFLDTGSVPRVYLEELAHLARTSSDLTLEVDEEIERSTVCFGAGGKDVVVNGDAFAMVILARRRVELRHSTTSGVKTRSAAAISDQPP